MRFGTYVLVTFLSKDCRIKIGSLGTIDFKKGYYCYVGSAMGPGGLKSRTGRHKRLCKDKKANLRWHIDYFLVNKQVSLKKVVASKMNECKLSRKVGKNALGIRGFGCSDCKCQNHFYYFKHLKSLKAI
ncbi:MAG: DUF123 domain-containing protein [Candidatus Aenigmarchaeota archaeon]|nr:DUF123 domain-containing protein [Candidatus Aenigmarchaeota archaeon]